jgi:hypothetical protein
LIKKLPTGTDNEVSEWNQYRYDTGITYNNLTSVPMRADPEARCIKINLCIPVPLAKYQNGINTVRCLSVNHDSNALKCDGVDTAPVSEPDKLGPVPMRADPEAKV